MAKKTTVKPVKKGTPMPDKKKMQEMQKNHERSKKC
jgi:hypothetical protein